MRCRETYGLEETLEELDVLVHGVHLGLQLHLVGISSIHILKEDPVIRGHLRYHPEGDTQPNPAAWLEEGDVVFSCVAPEEGSGGS